MMRNQKTKMGRRAKCPLREHGISTAGAVMGLRMRFKGCMLDAVDTHRAV
jgi:hypothetical protein